MKQPTLLEMLKAGFHFGHIPSKRHPKMKPFIFGVRSGVHIIDLEQTQHLLDKALHIAKDTTAKGGTVLFVATKRQAQDITKEAAEKCGAPYIHKHWIGGLLTNFAEIKKVIKRYNSLKKKYDEKSFEGISKKDRVLLDKEFEKLGNKVGGISTLTKTPDVIFIIDIKKEKTGLAEATKMKIPVIGVCDSNTNPDLVTYPIPGNDDASKAITLMMNLMSEAVSEGRVEYEKGVAELAKKNEEVAAKLKKEREVEKAAKDKAEAAEKIEKASTEKKVDTAEKEIKPKKTVKKVEATPKQDNKTPSAEGEKKPKLKKEA